MMLRTSLGLTQALLLSSLAHAAPAALPEVEAKSPLPFPTEQKGRASFLKTIKRRTEPGAPPIDENQSGWFCGRQRDWEWNDRSAEVLMPTALMFSRFKASLQQAHFPVPLPPPQADSLFDEVKPGGVVTPSKSDNESLQVGVMIKQVLVNSRLKSANTVSGEAYVNLFWQVFAPEQKKVIFQTTTEGVFRGSELKSERPLSALPMEAFGVAVRNLLAEPDFLSAVLAPPQPMASVAAAASGASAPADAASSASASGLALLMIDGVQPHESSISKVITPLRSAVATVFGDVGSGTGFFVGRSGWLLTNQHVVGKSRYVKVRLATGRELVGEVQRSDAARDITLVKTEVPGVQPMAVRLTDPGIGDDVYALGSPLGDAFNTTLTHGILSGEREMGGQLFLQSDVAVLPGSSGGPLLDKSGLVVGVTVMRLGAKGIAGMNFFIPIAEALRRLNVEVQAETPAR
jgi:S1-C subfamily serine protease